MNTGTSLNAAIIIINTWNCASPIVTNCVCWEKVPQAAEVKPPRQADSGCVEQLFKCVIVRTKYNMVVNTTSPIRGKNRQITNHLAMHSFEHLTRTKTVHHYALIDYMLNYQSECATQSCHILFHKHVFF